MLYKEAITKFKLWDADSLDLNVWEVNEEASKFYDPLRLRVKSTHMEFKLK